MPKDAVFVIVGASRITSATAWALSSAGRIPSVRDNVTVAFRAASSEHETYVARPESCSIACSGPTLA